MSAWWEGAQTAMDWLDDNEWAGSLIGDLIKDGLSKDPKMDYNKILEMAIKDAVINSPDQNTPTMSSRWVVDPKTGKRVQTVEYTEAIKPLFDMLVNHAGAPTDTYHAPDSFDAMLGGYINDREQHMGLPQSKYEPYEPGDWWSPGGGGSSGVPGGGSTPPPTGPNGTGPRAGGHNGLPGGGNINPNENTGPGGGTGGLGRPGGAPAGATDPMRDQQALIRELMANGVNVPGGDLSKIDLPSVSTSTWEKIEKVLGYKPLQYLLQLVGLPNVASAMKAGKYFVGRGLNKRYGAAGADLENQEWGSYDTPDPGGSGFTGNYWDTLLGSGTSASTPGMPRRGIVSLRDLEEQDRRAQEGREGGGPGGGGGAEAPLRIEIHGGVAPGKSNRGTSTIWDPVSGQWRTYQGGIGTGTETP